ncbi:hypothetical protein [Chromohalobacter israelensis]|uniref:hypothetical protein n=1 Tax=Chromohalobacter israelensis TaxID=141390 RepID=UPI00265D0BC3|nr:hypothetical protein [Chromohalobacter salexigens]
MAVRFPPPGEMHQRAQLSSYGRRETGAQQAQAAAADLYLMAERRRDESKKRPHAEGVYLRQIARVVEQAAEVLEREAMLARDFNRESR